MSAAGLVSTGHADFLSNSQFEMLGSADDELFEGWTTTSSISLAEQPIQGKYSPRIRPVAGSHRGLQQFPVDPYNLLSRYSFSFDVALSDPGGGSNRSLQLGIHHHTSSDRGNINMIVVTGTEPGKGSIRVYEDPNWYTVLENVIDFSSSETGAGFIVNHIELVADYSVSNPAYTIEVNGTKTASLSHFQIAPPKPGEKPLWIFFHGGSPVAGSWSVLDNFVLTSPDADKYLWPLASNFGSFQLVDFMDSLSLGEFEVGVLDQGETVYLDEDHTITAVPEELEGSVTFKGLNHPDRAMNTAIAFDGVGETLQVAPSSDLNLADQWTIEFRMKVLKDSSQYAQFFRKTGAYILYTQRYDHHVWLRAPGVGDFHRFASPDLVTGEWHHIAITWDTAADETRFYMDGVLANVETGIDTLSTSANPLFIGAGLNNAVISNAMTEVRIWDHARSQEQIENNRRFRLENPDQEQGLIAYWPLSEVAEDVAPDLSGNENHATITSAQWLIDGNWPVADLAPYLGFQVDRPTTVYIAHDKTATVPEWIQRHYVPTTLEVGTTAGDFELWSRDIQAREDVIMRFDNDSWTPELNDYWVVLKDKTEALDQNTDTSFNRTGPTVDYWEPARHNWKVTNEAVAEAHTAEMVTDLTRSQPNLDFAKGFQVESTIRIPRFGGGTGSGAGLILLADPEDTSQSIRAEWQPYNAGGVSALRLVGGNGEVVDSWGGSMPKPVDNNVGSTHAGEILMEVGTPVFTNDSAILFAEDFEGDVSGWTSGSYNATADQWEIGQPTQNGPAGGARSGVNVAATNLASGYEGESDSWLRSPVVDLTAAGQVSLTFWEYMDVDTFVGEETGNFFHYGRIAVVDADTLERTEVISYSESIADWTRREIDLSAFAGGKIMVEFGIVSDWEMHDAWEGWYLDDIEIAEGAPVIAAMPEYLAVNGTLYGIPTDSGELTDSGAAHLQFTLQDRGAGNPGGTVFVAWDTRASGLEPDWLRNDFRMTDHFIVLSGENRQHRLWAREFGDGDPVTLPGGAAFGGGPFPEEAANYFVLFGDARPGLDSFYTLRAEAAREGDSWNIAFSLTDADGHTKTIQTTADGNLAGRTGFGVFAHYADSTGQPEGSAPVWEFHDFSVSYLVDSSGFDAWRDLHFPGQLDQPEISGPDASPAGDGVANLLKYALDLSPWTAVSSADLPRMDVTEDGLILVYSERTDVSDIEYIPEASVDLIHWETTGISEYLREAGDASNLEEVGVLRVFDNEADRGFIRLRVEQK